MVFRCFYDFCRFHGFDRAAWPPPSHIKNKVGNLQKASRSSSAVAFLGSICFSRELVICLQYDSHDRLQYVSFHTKYLSCARADFFIKPNDKRNSKQNMNKELKISSFNNLFILYTEYLSSASEDFFIKPNDKKILKRKWTMNWS